MVAIIGILAAVAIPKLLSAIEKSKVGAASGNIGAFNEALSLYQVDANPKVVPATSLNQLISDNISGWHGPYMATITADAWGNSYVYSSSGSNYTIQSLHDSDYNKAETIRYCTNTGVIESLPL